MTAKQLKISGEQAIAVFDSGLGGLNFLKKALNELPQENFIYFGDTKNAPYGDKDPQTIINNTLAATDNLLNYGIKALVVACNTATNIAMKALREKYPQLIIIGMEPAIKPATAWLDSVLPTHSDADVVVISTEATAHSANLQRLIALYGREDEIHLVGCSGLVELIEGFSGLSAEKIDKSQKQKLDAYFTAHVDSFMNRSAQALVLGCTHYIFLRSYLAQRYPQAELFDGDLGTLHNLRHRLSDAGLFNCGTGRGKAQILCSGADTAKFYAKAEEFLAN